MGLDKSLQFSPQPNDLPNSLVGMDTNSLDSLKAALRQEIRTSNNSADKVFWDFLERYQFTEEEEEALQEMLDEEKNRP